MSLFYLGTTFSRYREARTAIDQITALGHECVEDWTRNADFGPDGDPLHHIGDGYVEQKNWHALSTHALAVCDEVARADGFFVFLAQTASVGWPTEFGAGLQSIRIHWSKAVVYVVAPFKTTIFMGMDHVYVLDTLEEVLPLLGVG